jgi:hypothetical protein
MSTDLLQLHKHAIILTTLCHYNIRKFEHQKQSNFPSALQLSTAHCGAAAVTAVVTSSVVAQVEKSGLNAPASPLACSLQSCNGKEWSENSMLM